MDEQQIKTKDEMLENWGRTYLEFLDLHKLTDNCVVKAGYYAGAIEIVESNPYPDTMVQLAVLGQLRKSKHDAMHDYLESVEMLFLEQCEKRLRVGTPA